LSDFASRFAHVWQPNELVAWRPNTCELGADWSSGQVRQMLSGAGTVLFVGDSTVEELFSVFMESLRHESWTFERNSPELQLELAKAYIQNQNRLFDSRDMFGKLTLRFLWNGGVHSADDGVGLAVFRSVDWRARLDAFMRPRDCQPSSSCPPPVVVFGSGLHDLKYAHFTFGAYEKLLEFGLKHMVDSGALVVLLTASPKMKAFSCGEWSGLGTPGVRKLNEIAKRVAKRVPGVTLLDLAELRYGSPFDGDGHHWWVALAPGCLASAGANRGECSIKKYYLQKDWQGEKTFGASCLWRARLLMSTIAGLLRGSGQG
jgi:hypothetical protein